MLTKLEITRGRLVLSATNPVAITNASVAAGLNFSRSRIAITIGVSSNAAPSFANRAEMAAPRMTTSGNSRRPRPPPQRATCRAAQWKKPRFVQQQRDDDQGDERERGVPDDVPDDRDVREADRARRQSDDSAAHGGPADAQTAGLPDDEHQRHGEDRKCEHQTEFLSMENEAASKGWSDDPVSFVVHDRLAVFFGKRTPLPLRQDVQHRL